MYKLSMTENGKLWTVNRITSKTSTETGTGQTMGTVVWQKTKNNQIRFYEEESRVLMLSFKCQTESFCVKFPF